jgi:hypothetical protein
VVVKEDWELESVTDEGVVGPPVIPLPPIPPELEIFRLAGREEVDKLEMFEPPDPNEQPETV